MRINTYSRVRIELLIFIRWGADGQLGGEGSNADIGNWNLDG